MLLSRDKLWLVIGTLLGLFAVVLGAFGAHGLKSSLNTQHASLRSMDIYSDADIADKLHNWETAAQYQMYHALALLAVGLVAARRCGLAIHLAGAAFTLGSLLFSGCLYAWVLGGPQGLVHGVPIGGTLLIVGWFCLAVAVCRLPAQVGNSSCRVE
jgi:uncharacterized membrane protein YgdD (TMEM256/DUF423 family)